MYGVSVEFCCDRDMVLLRELEIARKGLESPRHAITSSAAQFNQVIWSGDGNQKATVAAQDAPKFTGIHSPGYRENERERAVRIGYHAVGVSHHPLALGEATRRGLNRRNRNIDTMRLESGSPCEVAEIKPATATSVKNDVLGCNIGDLGNRVQKRRRHAKIVQTLPADKSSRGVAWMLGPPLLRLQQVDVSASGDVEGMASLAEQPPAFAMQRQAAIANWTEEHEV